MNGFGINPGAVAFAIKTEREQWAGEWPSLRDAAHRALDRLSRDLAISLHPDKRTDFLTRSGTKDIDNG